MTRPPDGPGGADARADVRRPWLPACLAAHGLDSDAVQALRYLVVEEMVEDVAVVTVSEWPAADGHGRLRFDDADIGEVAVPTAALHAQLYRGWLRRRPRIGDVFAATVDPAALQEAAEGVWGGPLARLLPGAVYDVTEEARKVAKLAAYAVRTDILDAAEAHANDLDAKAVRNDRPAPHRAHLDPTGAGTAR